jgi:superfamily II DNA or RNA helicase
VKIPFEFAHAKRIVLPEVWAFHCGTGAIRVGQLAEPSRNVECEVVSDQPPLTGSIVPGGAKWTAKIAGHDILLLPRTPKGTDSHSTHILILNTATLEGDVITPGPKSTWEKHPLKLTGDESQAWKTACESWIPGIEFRTEVRNEQGVCVRPGLRPAQTGALHAVAAHWTVSNKPALAVMPTGTGKTEVMLACLVMSRPQRLLVIVPSNALRLQTFDKFCRLGILPSIGVVPTSTIRPVTGMLKGRPGPEESELIRKCNVLVTTAAAIQSLPQAELRAFLKEFDQIYFDEAHHLPSESWRRIAELAAEKKVLQFTATPFRLDGQRIPGRIIYNFPLRHAQAQGYFRKIRFVDAFETDEEAGDASIARLAVEQLRKDLAAGLNHVLLARANTTMRAEALFRSYYEEHKDLSPTVIHSQIRGYRQTLQDIKAGKHKIVVCVDMFGEGFDLPSLKVAALHDPHKSLAISLQFTGRFTRDAKGIGDPTVIANTADPRVSDAIEDLYAEDADWNSLMPELSAKAIQSQMDFSDFLERMDNRIDLEEDDFGLNVLRPAISTVIYKADSFSPTRYRKWLQNQHVEQEWFSKDKDLVIFITRSRTPIEWATIKDTTDETWDLFMLAYDAQQKLLFIHSSQKGSLYPDLAKAVSGEKVQLLEGEKMFRAFHGMTRLIFHSGGLYNKGSKLRFRMFTGLDIMEAISPSAQANATKSNLFGVGHEDGELVSVGVSHKGRVWSMSSGSVPDWREWCRKIGAKILDSSIPTDEYLKHTLRPKEIAELPKPPVLLIALPIEWYSVEAETMRLYEGNDERNAFSFEIKGYMLKNQNTLEMAVGWDGDAAATFDLVWGKADGAFLVTQTTGTKIELKVGRERTSLAEFLTEHPPTVYFIDGSEAHGGKLLETPTELAHLYDPTNIVEFDWSGVDITKESKWKNGQVRPDAVQARLIDHVKAQPNQIVFDDDDAGEVADVVEIVETKDTVLFRLYHCKYSGGAEPGKRVKDPAEVSMQAVRSLRWLNNPRRLVGQLLQRERRYLKGRTTRFEKGTAKALVSLKRRLRKLRAKAEICIVQPGISKAACDPEVSTMLGAANNLIQDMTGSPLKVIGSQ